MKKLLFLAVALANGQGQASLLTIPFTGTITTISDPSHYLSPSLVAVGNQVSGSFTYDPSVPNSQSTTVGQYIQTATGAGMVVTIHGPSGLETFQTQNPLPSCCYILSTSLIQSGTFGLISTASVDSYNLIAPLGFPSLSSTFGVGANISLVNQVTQGAPPFLTSSALPTKWGSLNLAQDQPNIGNSGISVSGNGSQWDITYRLTSLANSPSLQTLANLSNNVYSGNAGDGSFTFLTDNCSTISSQCGNVGFRGVAYATADKSQIVIAFRGTVPGDPLITFKNAIADASFVDNTPSATLSKSVAYAAAFVKAIEQAYPTANITLAGHSLGGAIAQLVGKASGFTTDAFDAPGGAVLYSSLSSQLTPVDGLSSGGTNINYRLYGDQVSLAGSPIGSTITFPDPTGTTFASTGIPALNVVDNLGTFVTLHSLAAMTGEIDAQPISSAGEPNVTSALENVIEATSIASNLSGFLNLSFVFDVADITATYILDPSAGSNFTLLAQAGSPDFASIALPALTGVAGYDVRFESGNIWSPAQFVLPGTQFLVSGGADGIEFDPVDQSGNGVVISGSFFDVTFASTGTFSGMLTEVQPIPEPRMVYPAGTALLVLITCYNLRRRRGVDCSLHKGSR